MFSEDCVILLVSVRLLRCWAAGQNASAVEHIGNHTTSKQLNAAPIGMSLLCMLCNTLKKAVFS